MVWYFQSSPHDTHDWDSTQTPVLFDGEINGQPRKLLAQAARNGHFFVLDRTNGKAIVSSEYVKTNWSTGYDEKGQPIPNPAKHPQIDGALVSPNQGGATNWPPPSFSPQTGLFYVSAARAFSVYYIYDPGRQSAGLGRHRSRRLVGVDAPGDRLQDRQGEVEPQVGGEHPLGAAEHRGQPALHRRAVRAIIVALNATTGDALWHARLGSAVSNGPITYELDGTQYVIVGAGDTLWAFAMQHDERKTTPASNEIATPRGVVTMPARRPPGGKSPAPRRPFGDRDARTGVDRRLGADARAGTRPGATAAGGRGGATGTAHPGARS